MIRQVVYAVERAWAVMPEYEQEEEKKPFVPRVKFLINVRGGGFRIPDANYRAAVFDTMR